MSNSEVLKIDSIAFGGDGIARSSGKVWFVPFVIPNEVVEAAPREEKKDFVRADLVRVVTAAEDRIEPLCPYFGRCGGCRYQHIQYERQLDIKAEQVRESLRRIAGLQGVPVARTVGSPESFFYRNRITVHVRDGRIGFHHVNGRSIVDVERCVIASEQVNETLAAFRKRRNLMDGPAMLRDFEGRGFRQVNNSVAELLRAHVCQSLSPENTPQTVSSHLVDVFCGSGFFAKALRDHYKKVSGIEWSHEALELAAKDAQAHENYYEGDAASVLPSLLAEQSDSKCDVIVDPPSQGLGPAIVNALLTNSVRHIVYTSCNPATLARDLKQLSEQYEIRNVTPFDMFPQTAQVEVVVLLANRELN